MLDDHRLFDIGPESEALAQKWGYPPFTILDARAGDWQARKRRWLSLGIRSELGRGGNLLNMSDVILAGGYAQQKAIPGGGTGKNSAWPFKGPAGYATQEAHDAALAAQSIKHEGEQGKALPSYEGGTARQPSGGTATWSVPAGTSIFDPVLSELAYRWFCPPAGRILDPFAGGSVRGIVAAVLGRHYVGIDLSAAQIAANRQQAQEIIPHHQPQWIEGDSRFCQKLAPAPYDFIFTCPPYAFLEQYSDDPADLSLLPWEEFASEFRKIVIASCEMLQNDRFAAIVVGNLRAKDGPGQLHDLCGLTIEAFAQAGLSFHNDAILVTPTGSLPIRAGRIFTAGRKLGRTHQYLLTFCKGDPRKATAGCDQDLDLGAWGMLEPEPDPDPEPEPEQQAPALELAPEPLTPAERLLASLAQD